MSKALTERNQDDLKREKDFIVLLDRDCNDEVARISRTAELEKEI